MNLPNNDLVYNNKILSNIQQLKNSHDYKYWNKKNINFKNSCIINNYTNGVVSTMKYIKSINNLSIYPTSIYKIPSNKCKQVVLGTLDGIHDYFDKKEYVVLASNNWSEKLNKNFVLCALNALFDNQVSCKYHVRIIIPKDRTRLITKNNTPRITLLELCLFLQESPLFTIYKYKFPSTIESVIDYDMYFLSKKASNQTPRQFSRTVGGNNKTRKTLKTLKTRKQ
jgi:hypothetical protein